MADLPDIGVDWPDLSRPEPPPPPDLTPPPGATPAPDAAPVPADQPSVADAPALSPSMPGDEPTTADDGDQGDQTLLATIDPTEPLRYSYSIEGLGDAADDLLHERFDALSVLRAGERERANVAQIRRRGRTDATLLDELLRARGYYDSRTRLDFRAGTTATEIRAILAANPGDPYLLAAVDLDGLSGDEPGMAALRALFTVKPGDRADVDTINTATAALRTGLLDRGYPFADVSEPVLVVEHERHSATLNMTVETGGFRRIGRILVNPDAPFDARHVAVIGRFAPGDPYNQEDMVDLNRALIATGLVSQITITPKPGATDELVDLDLHLGRAPVHTIAGEIGYGTGEGARVEASWQHRNFFPPEGTITLRGVLGQQEQSVTATLRRANFGRRDRVLNLELSAANLDQPAYQARIAGIGASLERQTNLIFQKDWAWSLGAELRVSDERDLYGADLVPRRRTYLVAALPTGINYDDSDDLLDPRRGFRLGARVSPEVSLQGSVFSYIRMQFDGSYYLQASERVTIAGRGRLGTIVGASRDRIAPTRRFYAGGGGSVRGYSYQAIGPRDANNAPLGGRSLGELSLEARFRFGTADQFGVVPFVDAGTISSEPWPSIKEMRVGAGVGFRYYSSFGADPHRRGHAAQSAAGRSAHRRLCLAGPGLLMAADEPLPVEATPQAPPPKRKRRWSRLSFAFLAFLLLLVALAGGALRWIDSQAGHRFLLSRLTGFQPPSGLRITVGSIEGSLFKHAWLRDVRFYDGQGQFARIEAAEVQWYPLAWFANRLDIDKLHVTSAELARLPKFKPSGTRQSILPGFDIRLMDLRIDRLALGAPVTGRAHVVRGGGRIDVRGRRAVINLSANALDGADTVRLSLDSRPDDGRFDIDAVATAPQGGRDRGPRRPHRAARAGHQGRWQLGALAWPAGGVQRDRHARQCRHRRARRPLCAARADRQGRAAREPWLCKERTGHARRRPAPGEPAALGQGKPRRGRLRPRRAGRRRSGALGLRQSAGRCARRRSRPRRAEPCGARCRPQGAPLRTLRAGAAGCPVHPGRTAPGRLHGVRPQAQRRGQAGRGWRRLADQARHRRHSHGQCDARRAPARRRCAGPCYSGGTFRLEETRIRGTGLDARLRGELETTSGRLDLALTGSMTGLELQGFGRVDVDAVLRLARPAARNARFQRDSARRDAAARQCLPAHAGRRPADAHHQPRARPRRPPRPAQPACRGAGPDADRRGLSRP